MNEMLIVLTVFLALAMGWSIGANDAANSLGTAVGARVLTLKQAIILVSVFGFLGAVLQGGYVTKTIGNGIIKLQELPAYLMIRVALVSIFSCCIFIVIATYWKMPISTSHSIVGAVAGAGLAIHAQPDWRVLLSIFICWIFTPLGAALIGYIFYRILEKVFPRVVPARYSGRVITVLIIFSGCYVAFSWGANDVANATGLLEGARILPGHTGVMLGGLAIVLGIVTWGYKVIETIGSKITHLIPLMAFAVQLASAVNVHIYTLFGIPVSTSHSIVGAIFGVGLVKGIKVINFRILLDIFLCWVATPLVSGAICYAILSLFNRFFSF